MKQYTSSINKLIFLAKIQQNMTTNIKITILKILASKKL